MKNKNKFKIKNFVWLFVAAFFFLLRYVAFIKVDRPLSGVAYMSFVEKLEYCGRPIVEALELETCKNIGFYNSLFWVIFAILIVVQLFVIYKKTQAK